MPNILEAQNLAKNYGSFTAVKRIPFDIDIFGFERAIRHSTNE